MSKITEKQDLFCREFIVDFNAYQAAVRAGYSPKAARQQASRLLTNENITARIAELKLERIERVNVSADDVVRELVSLGFWNIKTFVGDDNVIKELKGLRDDQTKPVLGLKVKERTNVDGSIEITTELKLADKHGALVSLGRHLGIFEVDNKQKGASQTVMVGFKNMKEEEESVGE
jgi:phage terminase small subunit